MEISQKIPNGYKQTEIGVIPEDWDLKRLDEIIDKFVNGGTPSTQNIIFWNGNIPWITGADILNQKVAEIRRHITSAAVKKSSTNVICKGNLLLVSRTGVGKLAIAPCDIAISQDFTGIYPKKESLLTEYLFRFFDFHKIFLKNSNQGTSIQGITRETLAAFLIPLPTKTEQSAIVNVLSDIDILIEKIETLIEKKKLIKQGAMQELLTGKKRLSGFGNGRYKQTELGMIPEDWDIKKLKDIGEISGSGVDKKSRSNEIPSRLLNYLDVFHKDFIYSKDISQWVTAKSEQIKRCSINKGDIFFTPSSEMRWDIAISAVAMEDISDAVYSYHLVRLRLFKEWDLTFRTYIFKTKAFLNQAETICEGSGKRYVISLNKFREMTISFPTDMLDQSAIAAVLFAMDAEIDKLEVELSKYKNIKQGMMQTLLMGKIRLI